MSIAENLSKLGLGVCSQGVVSASKGGTGITSSGAEGNVLVSNGSSWTTTSGGSGPKITQVQVTNSQYNVLDDTAVSISGGYIKITGTGFVTGCQVIIGGAPAISVTPVGTTILNCQVPAQSANSYIVYVTNPDGGTAIAVNGLTYSPTPTWVTGSTLSAIESGIAVSVQLGATGANVFSVQAGSQLPPGLTLSSTGLLSGTVTISSNTTYSFIIEAVDTELQEIPRTFSVTVVVIFYGTIEFNILNDNGLNSSSVVSSDIYYISVNNSGIVAYNYKTNTVVWHKRYVDSLYTTYPPKYYLLQDTLHIYAVSRTNSSRTYPMVVKILKSTGEVVSKASYDTSTPAANIAQRAQTAHINVTAGRLFIGVSIDLSSQYSYDHLALLCINTSDLSIVWSKNRPRTPNGNYWKDSNNYNYKLSLITSNAAGTSLYIAYVPYGNYIYIEKFQVSDGTNLLANKIYQSNTLNYPGAIALDSSENLYVTYGEYNTSSYTVPANIMKLNSSLALQWARSINGATVGNSNELVFDSSDNLYARIGNFNIMKIETATPTITWQAKTYRSGSLSDPVHIALIGTQLFMIPTGSTTGLLVGVLQTATSPVGKTAGVLSYTADTRTLSAITPNYTSDTSSWGSGNYYTGTVPTISVTDITTTTATQSSIT